MGHRRPWAEEAKTRGRRVLPETLARSGIRNWRCAFSISGSSKKLSESSRDMLRRSQLWCWRRTLNGIQQTAGWLTQRLGDHVASAIERSPEPFRAAVEEAELVESRRRLQFASVVSSAIRWYRFRHLKRIKPSQAEALRPLTPGRRSDTAIQAAKLEISSMGFRNICCWAPPVGLRR